MSEISTEVSQQTTTNVFSNQGGVRVLAASATCSIRPNRGMSISIDVADKEALESVRAEAAAGISAYLEKEIQKAAAQGIPVDSSDANVRGVSAGA